MHLLRLGSRNFDELASPPAFMRYLIYQSITHKFVSIFRQWRVLKSKIQFCRTNQNSLKNIFTFRIPDLSCILSPISLDQWSQHSDFFNTKRATWKSYNFTKSFFLFQASYSTTTSTTRKHHSNIENPFKTKCSTFFGMYCTLYIKEQLFWQAY